MSEWKKYKLGEVTDILPGYAFKSKDFGKSGIPVIKIKDIAPPSINMLGTECVDTSAYELSKISKYIIGKGDYVVAMTGATIGKIGRQKENILAYLNQRVARIKAKEGVCDNFIYYTISGEAFQQFVQNNIDSNSAQENISATSIGRYPLMLPPLEEQKRIAGVLSSLDDKIDLLNRENATLEALAETLFRHYFIEKPDPEWKEGKVGDYVIETIGGEWGTETSEGESNMPVRCLRGADIAHLNDGIATRTPLRYIKPSKYEKIKPNNGDVILEISGGTDTCSTGRVAYINEGVKQLFDYPIVFSNFCRLLRVKEEYTYFVYCYFRHLHKQGEFFNLENGSSGIHNLNYKAALYDDLGWPVPTEEKLVIVFGEKVKPYFDKINTNKKQILSLSAQRDTMLPRLMSGEVKVAE